MDEKQRARELFLTGCNCSQSVFAAFAPEYGIDEHTALKLSCGLGGGVGRLREVCGAVSGAALIISLKYASGETGGADKALVYKKVQRFNELFRQSQPSIICRDLLNGIKSQGSVPVKRDDEFYRTRPCLRVVEDAADALIQVLSEE